jgi:putative NADPH-quinone reductase
LTRALIVLAHPRRHSLCRHLADQVQAMAQARGWQVRVKDLCADGFDPRLTDQERESYYNGFRSEDATELERLGAAEVLILVFPTWWFGFPAVLKGWFDRVWAPGLAFDHGPDFGPMIPRLTALREVLAITTMGAPRWVDWLVLRRPLARTLRWGIVRPCAPGARVTWMPLYRAEGVTPTRLAAFEARLASCLGRMAGRLR